MRASLQRSSIRPVALKEGGEFLASHEFHPPTPQNPRDWELSAPHAVPPPSPLQPPQPLHTEQRLQISGKVLAGLDITDVLCIEES